MKNDRKFKASMGRARLSERAAPSTRHVGALGETRPTIGWYQSWLRPIIRFSAATLATVTLNALQETQILDLLAYVTADGNSNHVAFASGAATGPAAE